METIKAIENKIEEVRKATFNEINRLEAMLEKDDSVTVDQFKKFEGTI